MGLPCAHDLQCRPRQMIPLSNFHQQWHLKFAAMSSTILDPVRLESRRNLESALRRVTTSTGRIQSAPETEKIALERDQALEQ